MSKPIPRNEETERATLSPVGRLRKRTSCESRLEHDGSAADTMEVVPGNLFVHTPPQIDGAVESQRHIYRYHGFASLRLFVVLSITFVVAPSSTVLFALPIYAYFAPVDAYDAIREYGSIYFGRMAFMAICTLTVCVGAASVAYILGAGLPTPRGMVEWGVPVIILLGMTMLDITFMATLDLVSSRMIILIEGLVLLAVVSSVAGLLWMWYMYMFR
ncbi:hypothetical protein C8Q76DRAFT_140839 [Earliella scabrosa]|nr:hypothetical protein C8Q76DRAFT_140839 [Earliella scabrosa]